VRLSARKTAGRKHYVTHRSVLDSSSDLRSIRRISAYRQGATIATEAISYSRLVVALTSKRGRKIASTRFCRARVSSWPTCIGDIDVVSERPALSTSVLAVPVREVRSRAAMRLARRQEAWIRFSERLLFPCSRLSFFSPNEKPLGKALDEQDCSPSLQRRTTFHEHVNPWRPSRTPWSGPFYGPASKWDLCAAVYDDRLPFFWITRESYNHKLQQLFAVFLSFPHAASYREF
jgi:hypothetical protein